ncbi:MAG: HEAT repeat domain-containing protein [Phycisphaerales bacterium]|nr:HEAT repeat domain-containing protein [Planctomycetota bacterium]MCH8507396.1 HEAT repeat domain-containing protein [Phycisphaerales bacterium]
MINYLKRLVRPETPLPRPRYGLDQPGGFADNFEALLRLRGPAAAEFASEIAATMRTVGPDDWIRVDQDLRSPWIAPADVAKLTARDPDDAIELLGLASFSASGYARQVALEAMLGIDHPRSVPYALIRLGDWVPQVAEVAVRVLRARMASGDGTSLMVHRGLIERLDRVGRTDLGWFQQEIYSFMRSSSGRQVLEAGLCSADAGERSFCYRVLQPEFGHRPELVAQASLDPSPHIRRWLAGCIVRREVHATRETLLTLLSDQSTMVARLVIRSLDDASCAQYRHELIALSFSDARPVRQSARYAVQRAGPFDFADACRRTIEASAAGEISAGVVGCLAESGNQQDVGTFVRLLNHDSGRVRSEAASGIMRQGGPEAAAQVVWLLDDQSGRVRRAVVSGLAAAPAHLWVAPARGILASGSPKGRVAALKALCGRGGWDPLPDLLAAITSDDPYVRFLGWDNLAAWQRRFGVRGWIRPTPECRAILEPVWRAVRNPEEPPDWWDGLRDMVDAALNTGTNPV